MAAMPLTPPVQGLWQSALSLRTAVSTGTAIYGVTAEGRFAGIDPTAGSTRWQTGTGYLGWLAAVGSRLYGFRANQGLVVLTDQGATFSEVAGARLSPCDEATPLSHPAVDDGLIYFAHRTTLIAADPVGVLRFSTALSGPPPFVVKLWKRRRLVVVDGWGQVTLWAVTDRFTQLWSRPIAGPRARAAARPGFLAGERLYAATEGSIRAIRFDGALLWEVGADGIGALGAYGDSVYAAAVGHARALDAGNGAHRWSRHWLSAGTGPRVTELLAVEGAVYVGTLLERGADLFAVRANDGLLTWHSPVVAGLPLPAAPGLLLAYGSAGLAGFGALRLSPAVSAGDVGHTPRPLLGSASLFTGSQASVRLKVRATVTLRPWREGAGYGSAIVDGAELGPGTHTLTWNAATAYSDAPQFGRLVAEVSESGMRYAVAAPLPVNTMPDIVGHWAQNPVEVMLYHRFVGGYPDLTFRPDAMVNRAESATIIAKTLGLAGPSPGFRTKFTDTAGHWARAFIEALEERGIIGGFEEADGTYTYRPAAAMTRAQEARILVKAYGIPPATDPFPTRFIDIAGHWAEAEIKALEAGGYVTGFREADGTYTYRPERLLTRAELCAMVVRIRRLTRP